MERPIPFSGEMVRAILDGRKTQTRRVMRPQPQADWRWNGQRFQEHKGYPVGHVNVPCPYGEVGDHLWVREAWKLWSNATDWYTVSYPATGPATYPIQCCRDLAVLKKRGIKNSRFMPREFSRITLEVKSVRVERVQEITQRDAIAEGLVTLASVAEFRRLWDSINAKRGYSWDVNPWVWVVEFEEGK